MSHYKITYFDGRGRAEISRLILSAAGVDFTDERVKDWPKGKEGKSHAISSRFDFFKLIFFRQ